ncbi:transposase domain-containing protein [Massilia pseudoviolaceinigra]
MTQSLLATCRLSDINPYDYFVDVLQRSNSRRRSRVARSRA